MPLDDDHDSGTLPANVSLGDAELAALAAQALDEAGSARIHDPDKYRKEVSGGGTHYIYRERGGRHNGEKRGSYYGGTLRKLESEDPERAKAYQARKAKRGLAA